MKRFLVGFLSLCLAAAVSYWMGASGAVKEGAARPPAAQATHAPEDVLRQMFATLQQGDLQALEGLLVSDHEYQELILPGSVRPGEPAIRMPTEKAEFYTRLHRTKSQYALANLINSVRRAGAELSAVRWEGSAKHYATYTLLPRPVLLVQGPEGSEELRPGLLVELHGRVRVLSYFSDD